jgi:hypothetical protein
MSTNYTNCDECNYDDTIKEYRNDTRFPNIVLINKIHLENIEKEKILLSKNLPVELCQYIIKMSNVLEKCNYCNNVKLCKDHSLKGKHYSNYYRGVNNLIMCNSCGWFEVT